MSDRVIDRRVVNIDQLELEHFEKGDKFACDALRIGPIVGAKDLGYSYDVVPPGKRSCPFHSHRAEEEMFFIVSGTGTLRYGSETRKIRAGDVICCPTGGPETAHQIVNDSDAPLAHAREGVRGGAQADAVDVIQAHLARIERQAGRRRHHLAHVAAERAYLLDQARADVAVLRGGHEEDRVDVGREAPVVVGQLELGLEVGHGPQPPDDRRRATGVGGRDREPVEGRDRHPLAGQALAPDRGLEDGDPRRGIEER